MLQLRKSYGLLLLIALTGCVTPVETPDSNLDQAEAQMLDWHNDVRRSEGMGSLRPDARLMDIAQDHAFHIAQRDQLTHIDDFGRDVRDRADDAGYRWVLIGENLGVGTSGAAVFDAWLDSSTHLDNILDPRFSDIGLGHVVTGSFGFVDEYWVVVFGDI